MKLEIRAARIDDDATLAALDQATWSTDVSPAPAPAPDAPFFEHGRAPQDVLVAELDGRLVGYVMIGREIELPCTEHVRALRGLAVDPDEQGRGIGRALMHAAHTRAIELGARRLTSRVLSTNAASLALHRSCGFEEEGRLHEEFLLDGAYVDDVLFARAIAQGA